MDGTSFISEWSGSPLITASATAIAQAGLPAESSRFLEMVGLPSNALWFDRTSHEIMCFDGVAALRELRQNDVSAGTWEAVGSLGKLIILGVFGMLFTSVDRSGHVWLIDGNAWSGMKEGPKPPTDSVWRARTFVNQGVRQFATCLLAYKNLCSIFEREAFDFDARLVRDAIVAFRRAVEIVDDQALTAADHFWPTRMNHAVSIGARLAKQLPKAERLGLRNEF